MKMVQTIRHTRRAMISRVMAGVVFAALGASIAPARAEGACAGDVCVEQAWTRATPGNAREAAAYFTIANKGTSDETLIAVSTKAAAHAMIHQTTRKDSVVQMRMVGSVKIAGNSRFVFAPADYHVMLAGLDAPLREGETLPLTFSFASGRTIQIDIPVLKITALGPERAADDRQGHGRH